MHLDQPSTYRVLCYIFYVTAGCLVMAEWDIGHARKELLAPEAKEQLRRAERIQLEVLALTDRGVMDPTSLTSTATARLKPLGYQVFSDRQPADVTVRIKCEERKTWEGPRLSGGDADMVDAAARLWKGPACQISYRLGTRASDWAHEVRAEAASVMSSGGQTDTGAAAISALARQLREDDFPFLLAAEWEQHARLIAALDADGTTKRQREVLVRLLGNMATVETIPRLTVALKDSDPVVAESAANALGSMGREESIPPLLSLFKNGSSEQHRIAAIGLGRLAPLHPGSDIVPTFLACLPTEPVPTQIIMVRALGKTTDRRIVEPLRALHRSVLKHAPNEMTPELHELKTTLGIALDQFDGTHTSE